jgi:hypothetical protein
VREARARSLHGTHEGKATSARHSDRVGASPRRSEVPERLRGCGIDDEVLPLQALSEQAAAIEVTHHIGNAQSSEGGGTQLARDRGDLAVASEQLAQHGLPDMAGRPEYERSRPTGGRHERYHQSGV